MEAALEEEFNAILKHDGVTDAILINEHGLCLTASSGVKAEMAGIISAIAQHAVQIEECRENPVINFQSDTKQCIIKKQGAVTTAIFKKSS